MSKAKSSEKTKALQTWLNQLLSPSPGLTTNGITDAKTKDAIKAFQTANSIHPASGKMTLATWKAIGRKIGPAFLSGSKLVLPGLGTITLPLWFTNVLRGLPVGVLRFNRATFFAEFMEDFGGLSQIQATGLEKLISFIEADPNINDVSWAAYMLSTVKLECAGTWRPIAEYGCDERRWPKADVCTSYTRNGKTYERKYGNPVTCPDAKLTKASKCPAGKASHTYYGRGYVQLTHGGNYKKLGDELGLAEELVHSPERVMKPETAYEIMSIGMRKGLFRSDKKGAHTLTRHLSEATKSDYKDYYQARNIINGVVPQTAQEMANDALKLEAILLASLI